jgi:hypothetical protein
VPQIRQAGVVGGAYGDAGDLFDPHQEDIGGMLNVLGLEPPPFMMRLAARRSARQYRRQKHRSPLA